MGNREDDLSEAIAESLARTDYGDILHQRGITIAALDDEGRMIALRPDGTSEIIQPD